MKKRPMEERNEVISEYLKGEKGYKKISEEFKIPLDTVKSWIRRCKKSNGLPTKKLLKLKENQNRLKFQESRIKRLEMEVELLKNFLLEVESDVIKR